MPPFVETFRALPARSKGIIAVSAVAILAIASRSDGRPGFELSATTPHRSSHGADAHPIEPE